MANKKINSNGFDYVDLDLPSGTLWATCNVGASKPSDSGLYFQWGDTIGYTEDQIGTGEEKKKFAKDWSDYKWGARPNFTRYKITASLLYLIDDAARINMGGDWRMPLPTQIYELIDNTINCMTTQNGVKGMLFTSKKNASKSIFIPAAGHAWGGSVHGIGEYGGIWSNILSINDNYEGQFLAFDSNEACIEDSYHRSGHSVRGVIG